MRVPLTVDADTALQERGRPLIGALLRTPRGGRWWHRDRDRPIREWHGLLARRRIDRLQSMVIRREDLVQGFRQVLKKMEAVRDLGGRRGPLCIGARPIPGDHLHPGMLPQPLGHGVGRAIGEELHGLTALEINKCKSLQT